MKGAVFIALNEMVEEHYGLDTWFKIIDQAEVEGIYTSTENYADEELFKIVSVICELLDVELPAILKAFGEYLFHCLHKGFPSFANQQPDFFSFIKSIDSVIHVEVHKLDENVQTPRITVISSNENQALVEYYSHRKLCFLAEGLLIGAAKHFGIEINVSQSKCMHDGAACCELIINKVST